MNFVFCYLQFRFIKLITRCAPFCAHKYRVWIKSIIYQRIFKSPKMRWSFISRRKYCRRSHAVVLIATNRKEKQSEFFADAKSNFCFPSHCCCRFFVHLFSFLIAAIKTATNVKYKTFIRKKKNKFGLKSWKIKYFFFVLFLVFFLPSSLHLFKNAQRTLRWIFIFGNFGRIHV